MRLNVPSLRLATHTAPPVTTTPLGPLPTWIVCTTLSTTGSIRDTVPLELLVTQTAPAPTAIEDGLAPTWIVCTTVCAAGSIRDTASALELTTQRAPSPAANAVGDLENGTTAPARSPSGLIALTTFPGITAACRLDPRVSTTATAAIAIPTRTAPANANLR